MPNPDFQSASRLRDPRQNCLTAALHVVTHKRLGFYSPSSIYLRECFTRLAVEVMLIIRGTLSRLSGPGAYCGLDRPIAIS